MDASHPGEAGLAPRLLADAERHAAEGRVREAYVLLRWASRITPPGSVPALLLAYHRIRAARPSDAAASSELAPDAASTVSPRPHRLSASTARVDSDALGFPVPRFPTRAPELDPGAFVPAPRIAEPPAVSRLPVSVTRPHPVRPTRGRAVAVLVLAALGALAIAPDAVHDLGAHVWGERNAAAGAGEALRAGEPARALVMTEELRDPGPDVLLVRARAFLALGDSSAGAAALSAAAAHALASGSQAGEAARLLAEIRGREKAAADAYLRAFSAGLPPEQWPGAADALDRAGRRAEARRIRELLPIPSPPRHLRGPATP